MKRTYCKLKTLFLFILCISFLVVFSSCSSKTRTHNIITNEITNKIVDVQNITINDFQNAVEVAVEKVERAVVGVVLKEVNQINDTITSEDSLGVGSGVIYKAIPNMENGKLISYTYFVATNRHVVVDEEHKLGSNTKVYIYLGEEDDEIAARIVGYDDKVDIACLTFESTVYINPVEFADSDSLKKGTFVIAIGNPEGFDYYGSVTMGVVSSPLRYIASDTDGDGTNDFYCEYIQHDASINPGNSGGGLFTIDGKLVGINTMKFASTKIDNMGFALTSNNVKNLLVNYLEPGIEIVRPRLGVTGIPVKTLTPTIINANKLKDIPEIYNGDKPYGLYVSSISKGGSCDNSGLATDDIILELNDTKIKSTTDVTIILNSTIVGEKVKLKYYSRQYNTIKETTITLNSHI